MNVDVMLSRGNKLLNYLEIKKSVERDNQVLGDLSRQITLLQACVSQRFASTGDLGQSKLFYDQYCREFGNLE